MFVCVTSDCFADLPLDVSLDRVVDLEYTRVEISLKEQGNQLKPSQVIADLEAATAACRETQRLTPVAYDVDIRAPGEEYFRQFEAICRLAKATKVVQITVPSAELGTPFNEEIERLREIVRIATLDGVLVGLKTEMGRISQDPDTVVSLCENVKGLGVTLDPSHYSFGPKSPIGYDQLFRFVYHVQLRDTTKDQFQVRVGQGVIEYGRIIAQLQRVRYQRALSVHIAEVPGVDHASELRKLRLLLESLL